MKILAIGHSFIIDSNRKFWNDISNFGNHDVDMVLPKLWKSELVSTVHYEYNIKTDKEFNRLYPLSCFYQGNPSFFIFNPFKLYKVLNETEYDAIYLWQETWSFSALETVLLKMFSKNKKTKIYLHICQNLKKPKLKFLIPLEKFISKKISALFCCCGEIEEVIRWKNIETECKYFPFPYDESVYGTNAKNKTHKEKLTLGYFGRLSEEKGLDVLIKACDELYSQRQDFVLKIGGSGPYEQLLRSKEYVKFVGVIPHIEAPKFYNDVDIFVLPSETRPFWKEQFGRVLVEAVSSGCLVVGSDSGAIPEVLGLMEMPYVFKEGNKEDLSKKISSALNDFEENKAKDILENSMKKAFEHFSFESNAKRFSDIVFGDKNSSTIEFKEGKVRFLDQS